MSRGPDAGALLERALVAAARQAGCPVQVDAAEARSWQSATFVGARHAITLSGASSSQLAEWLAGIGEAEFALRGHLVADIAVDSVRADDGRCRVVLGALTVADG